jgi:hypothetical protein
MKKLTRVCLLLSLCASPFVAAPPPQSSRQSYEFQAAREFMQLKAIVFADLNRLEQSKSAKPQIAPIRAADANHQKTRNGVVYSAIVVPNKKLSVQVTSAVQPVSMESAAAR